MHSFVFILIFCFVVVWVAERDGTSALRQNARRRPRVSLAKSPQAPATTGNRLHADIDDKAKARGQRRAVGLVRTAGNMLNVVSCSVKFVHRSLDSLMIVPRARSSRRELSSPFGVLLLSFPFPPHTHFTILNGRYYAGRRARRVVVVPYGWSRMDGGVAYDLSATLSSEAAQPFSVAAFRAPRQNPRRRRVGPRVRLAKSPQAPASTDNRLYTQVKDENRRVRCGGSWAQRAVSRPHEICSPRC
jgi:hypothetical protein